MTEAAPPGERKERIGPGWIALGVVAVVALVCGGLEARGGRLFRQRSDALREVVSTTWAEVRGGAIPALRKGVLEEPSESEGHEVALLGSTRMTWSLSASKDGGIADLVSVEVACERSFSLPLTEPRIAIIDWHGPKSEAVIERLRKALDARGLRYQVSKAQEW